MSWWRCPNLPPCPHPGAVHDIEDLEGCDCGRDRDMHLRFKSMYASWRMERMIADREHAAGPGAFIRITGV